MLEAADPPVEHRAHEDEQLTDELGELRAQLGRQHVAHRRQQRDERVELVTGLIGRSRHVPAGGRRVGVGEPLAVRVLGELLRSALRRLEAFAKGDERIFRLGSGHRT